MTDIPIDDSDSVRLGVLAPTIGWRYIAAMIHNNSLVAAMMIGAPCILVSVLAATGCVAADRDTKETQLEIVELFPERNCQKGKHHNDRRQTQIFG